MADGGTRYAIDYSKRASKCKRCSKPIDKGVLRIAKLVPNIFSDDGGDMKQYHHPECIFEAFKKVKATTKVIEDPEDFVDDSWKAVKDEDKETVLKLIRAHAEFASQKKSPGAKAPKKASQKLQKDASKQASPPPAKPVKVVKPTYNGDVNHKDNSFKEFRRMVANISEKNKYTDKTDLMKTFFNKGSDKTKFQGDLHTWIRLLIPGVIKRIYNLQSKQLVKIFSRVFHAKESEMLTDLEQGDVAETISKFFEDSSNICPAKKAALTIHDVDNFLDDLTELTKEDEQTSALSSIAAKCTSNDLKMIVRLIKGDLRMQAGAKHVLDALHKDAHEAFNSSRQIDRVVTKIIELRENGTPNGPLDVGATLMTPVQPMLAMACKSVDMAFEKCPNGMYSEIKYDGERVQLHKNGDEFKYFSRSLKPVLPHKVSHFKEYIPKAFPGASELILDAEVLMVDNKTGDPLPFGSLGIHKGAGFKDATPCLFIFDCMYYNGENLMNNPIKKRKEYLKKVMVEVGNYIKFSEAKVITKKKDLSDMIKDVLNKGLEGLVLKDTMSPYEPGKRHWLKVKKDYLNDGAMADSADLIVLGAWYGSGKRGSIMSIFLMGCYDHRSQTWKTVSKVHTGHDDETLERLQKELAPKVVKIKQNYDSVPSWLECSRQMAPDFVAKDPKEMPCWEVTGAEFSKAELHTADGISIRFPRCTKIRDDKTWETATSLAELKVLFEESKKSTDIDLKYNAEKEESPVRGSPKNPMKRPSPDKQSPSSIMSSPVKKIRITDETVDVKLGPSGKSFDKVSIMSKQSGFQMEITQGDLFEASGNNVSLAHCISRDLKLGKGIAKLFRQKFGRMKELEEANAQIGDIAILKVGQRYVYNLVTKEKYSDSPTYNNLKLCLEKMRDHALEHNVKAINMPKIGCGLDKLNWDAVRTMIKNVFLETDIKISVYYLNQNSSNNGTPMRQMKMSEASDKPKSDVSESKYYPILDIAEGNLTPIETEPSFVKKEEESPLVFPGLPDVFTGDKIFLQKGMKNREKLERYIISYGGEVVDEHNFKDATVAVRASHLDSKKPIINSFGLLSKKKAPQVKEEWLYASIKAKSRKRLNDYEL